MAVNTLHIHIMEKLSSVKELLVYETDEKLAASNELSEAVVSSITIDKLIIGALEEAFFEMVSKKLYVSVIVWLPSNQPTDWLTDWLTDYWN